MRRGETGATFRPTPSRRRCLAARRDWVGRPQSNVARSQGTTTERRLGLAEVGLMDRSHTRLEVVEVIELEGPAFVALHIDDGQNEVPILIRVDLDLDLARLGRNR